MKSIIFSSEILETICYSSYIPPYHYTDVATCCVMRILFPQHKSTYCKEVGAKFTWEFISRFKINSTSCSYTTAKNEWQSSIVQELRGIVMDATTTCLCNSYRKYLCMKNCFVLIFLYRNWYNQHSSKYYTILYMLYALDIFHQKVTYLSKKTIFWSYEHDINASLLLLL